MNLDKNKIRRLLDEVVSTNGFASAQKADELLRYVSENAATAKPEARRVTKKILEDAAKVGASDAR